MPKVDAWTLCWMHCYHNASHAEFHGPINFSYSTWIDPLNAQGFDKQPPTPEHMDDGLAELDMLPVPEDALM